MALIEFKNDELHIDDSDFSTKPIIEAFETLIKKNGFDPGLLACGVLPSPDFGYFELADRFWRASLGIYSLGATNCFWERGAGYAEPWLFNARHTVELYVKGFLLSAVWLEQLQSEPHLSVEKQEFTNLRRELGQPHNLLKLYSSYLARITSVINDWNEDEIFEAPELAALVLEPEALEMLKELDETDETSFRFRYPSLKQEDTDSLQKLAWDYNPSMLLAKTGLPRKAGFFFDPVRVMNNLHKLITELKAVANYFNGISDYQDVMNDHWYDFLSQFGYEDYGY